MNRIASSRRLAPSLRTIITPRTTSRTTASFRLLLLGFPRQQLRLYSDSKPPTSNHANFYKTFGRPIFKVVLMGIFWYQLAYYAWVRMEQDEIKSETRDTIAEYEAQLAELEKLSKQRASKS